MRCGRGHFVLLLTVRQVAVRGQHPHAERHADNSTATSVTLTRHACQVSDDTGSCDWRAA
jgi:hypothetical protein